MSGVTPVSTAGAKYAPLSARVPPTCSVAPFDTASCTWASRFSAALRDTIGLYASSESSPAGRGVIAAARLTRAATKSS